LRLIIIVVVVFACILASMLFALAYQNAIKENDTIALSVETLVYNSSNASLKYLYDTAMLMYQTTVERLSDQHVEFMNNSIMLESRANASVITSMVNAQKDNIGMRMKLSIEVERGEEGEE